ncbi:MAG TPA: hypothetical protein PKD09_24385 [Aggregatilinea sp.]|jgi:hypothetical protein|uniref:hypothetical protein n=1 Tax=Aggregatilinea sp. TaxID=2806333 RepID=UPI002B5719C2|nr:hypothetical protein [Aggregatilinea sp.]HML24815.1 hypothetical protein [Aggregatilinea sp.]
MFEAFRRLLWPESGRKRQPPTPLTDERIVAGYRMFWTKSVYTWDPARRKAVAGRVQAVAAAPDFETTMLERRFRVEGLDDQAHSGASLLALLEVLQAVEAFEADAEND